ncbi:MAG: hypothetical protein ACREP4_06780 [Stenotrophomonas sp.]|uniref:hypothetical protein n=1 Tax=Stenotrophomonas sp. TaxID=69392 RepID=UPI003D6D93DB
MYWLFLLLALGAFVLAISTTQMWLLVLSLFASLLFTVLWVKGLFAARVGGVVSDAPRPLHAAELQALRDQLRSQNAAQEPAQDSPTTKNDPAQP